MFIRAWPRRIILRSKSDPSATRPSICAVVESLERQEGERERVRESAKIRENEVENVYISIDRVGGN